ncbi:mycofactocin system transcriptional regulator [Actinospica durhamensis]|uniref:Mycofactocin system transcriptional regulator n=1 Tax=Actinospica durhamensis TaxID=1508375 RepID=A0A941EIE9_9ACTN|nr:mycofactocin system transcriptional regulator [Actinospica durhamensis]MBR7833135.1 mycofactocin system transcriptional regulator [Actinospica durhamensis]
MERLADRELDEARGRNGRPRATSRAELERVGFELFAQRGFDEVTVEDIASAAGIGRRTFFRYYASKNALVWGDFEGQLAHLRELLAAIPASVPTMEALRTAIVEFNRYDEHTLPWHRRRMALILSVPALQADSTLRYNAWRAIVAEFAAGRAGVSTSALEPVLIGNVALATSVTAYELWLQEDSADLTELLDEGFRRVAEGL